MLAETIDRKQAYWWYNDTYDLARIDYEYDTINNELDVIEEFTDNGRYTKSY